MILNNIFSFSWHFITDLQQTKIILSFETLIPRPDLGWTMHRNFCLSSRRSNFTSNVVVSSNVPSPLGSLTIEPGNMKNIKLTTWKESADCQSNAGSYCQFGSEIWCNEKAGGHWGNWMALTTGWLSHCKMWLQWTKTKRLVVVHRLWQQLRPDKAKEIKWKKGGFTVWSSHCTRGRPLYLWTTL